MESDQRATDPTADIPEPSWWQPKRRSGTPRGRPALTRESIVLAALAVLDDEGLDALSMRRVAKQLNVGAASLYWHVEGKEQLLAMVIDRVIGEIPLPNPDPVRWKEQIRAFAHDGRHAFQRYRDVARASMGRIPMGPNFLRAVEWQLDLLQRAGIPHQPAAWFGDILALYVAAHALEDALAAAGAQDAAELGELLGGYMASLPMERFPALAAAGPYLMAGSPDERFEFGLALILRGLEAVARDEPPSSQ